MANIIFVGCGVMGSKLIQAFMDGQHNVTIVNRTREKALPFEQQGASYFPCLSSAAESIDADIIVFNISNYEACTEVVMSAPKAVKDKIVVNLSTGEKDKVESFSALISNLGGKFICGVLTCYPKNIGAERDGSIVFSGDAETYATAEPILSALSPANFYIGSDPSLASVFDTAWLAPHYGLIWGILQGAAVCRDCGIDVNIYADSIKVMIAALLDVICPCIKETVAKDFYPEATDSAIDVHLGGIRETIANLEKVGFNASPMISIRELVQKASDDGHSGSDIGIVANYLKK